MWVQLMHAVAIYLDLRLSFIVYPFQNVTPVWPHGHAKRALPSATTLACALSLSMLCTIPEHALVSSE